jgi:hypothetical protein
MVRGDSHISLDIPQFGVRVNPEFEIERPTSDIVDSIYHNLSVLNTNATHQ